jgi:kanamycin kinase
VIDGTPDPGLAPPPQVRALAAGRSIRPVWQNELGGLTFELGGDPHRFVKWAPADSGIDLGAEAVRMRWASQFVNVPQPFAEGRDETSTWLVTTALPGQSAVSSRWRADPATAVEQIGLGLRALHDALPVVDCPFDASVEARLADLSAHPERLDSSRWDDDHQHLTVADVLTRLADIPPVDRLVVGHGDTCAPNTLLTDDGRWSAHVDLGLLGVADRWADLAIATWSLGWNYGPGWEPLLLRAYGVAADPQRTAYYRLLWDLGP